jgi:rhamnosyl/mannosyltransferase
MKVLHVYRTYFPDPPGGLQEAIRQICISTQKYGVINTVFTLSPEASPSVVSRPEATVVRCRSWAAPASCDIGGFSAIMTFKKLAEEADIIHYYFPWPFADILRLICRPKKPEIMTYVSDVVRQRRLGRIYAPLMDKTLNAMPALVVSSPAYAHTSTVLANSQLAGKVVLVPLGIEEETCSEEPDTAIMARLGISENEPFFLFIGVLRYYKGLHTLLQAAKVIKAKIVIAGTGPEYCRLKKKVSSDDLQHVILAGQVTDREKNSLLKFCRAVVLPSHLRSEAYGMVLVEASMNGKPMVSCEIGTGTSFINLHNETGIVVPPESPEALADALKILLSDHSLALEYGAAARKRYESMFSGALMGKAYFELYSSYVNV